MNVSMRRTIPYELIAPAIFLFVLPITHTTPLRIACLVIAAATTIAAARKRVSLDAFASKTMRALLVVIAVWAAMAAIASATSIEPEYSWGEFRNEVVSPLGAFFVFLFVTASLATWTVWRNVLLASLAAVSVLAIVSFLGGTGWSREGFVGDRNAFSTYVVLAFPFVMLVWVRLPKGSPAWQRAGVALVGALALVAAAFTQNRNIWFAIAAELALFAALAWWRAPHEHRRALGRRIAVSAVVVVVALAATMVYVVRQKAAISKTSVEEQARFDRDPRFEIWAYAGARIAERPWTGHGFGRGILRRDFRTHFANPLKWHGHSMLVNYVMEAGVIGGVVLVALFVALLSQAATVYRDARPWVWPFGAWAIAMLVGIALKVTTDDVLIRENSLFFWSVLGMVFGLGLRAARLPEPR